MKKLFCLIITLSLVMLLSVPCLAESAEDPTGEETVTVFDRLVEYWVAYAPEILSGGSILTTLSLVFILWKKTKQFLVKLLTAGNETADVQDKQSKAINNLIDGINTVDERMTAFEEKVNAISSNNEAVTEHFKEVQKSLGDLAKILDTVYSHSKVLSQGTKDLVHTYCADCIKIAEHEINGGAEVAENVKAN